MLKPEEGWLAVSTDGFAQQNAARPPEHLVKELVQNALDALPESGGAIRLWTEIEESDHSQMWIHCQDSGCGIEDMKNLRTVFWTSKQDSHLKRGRMGRGFKEMLCLCTSAEVTSKFLSACFHTTAKGRRLFSIEDRDDETEGTLVSMKMPWSFEETTATLEEYFADFILPQGTTLTVNGNLIEQKIPKHRVPATITTEAFSNGRWTKPSTKTQLELVPSGRTGGLIYEMGIPVCDAEWDIGYHVNILQRVPMNPNRDAVMSGFCAKIHKVCLPTVLSELDDESARASWVGDAAAKTQDPALQKKVLERAFGENLARSVPNFGKFDHDADAEEATGAKIIDTKQLAGGFRELARSHVPTSLEVARAAKLEKKVAAAAYGTDPDEAKNSEADLIKKLGKTQVKAVCAFHKWLADEILKRIFPKENRTCTVRVANMGGLAIATWGEQFQVLTLALDYTKTWTHPLDQDNFATAVHEAAHELAAHHGQSFANAMENTAGAALAALFENRADLEGWKTKLTPA